MAVPSRTALSGGKLKIYTGAQPASADAAPTGTLLATITDGSGAHTAEVRATGTVTLSGSSGSITACTVNGLTVLGETVPFNTDLTTTAADLAEAINEYPSVPKITASSSGAVVTLTAPGRRRWRQRLGGGLHHATMITAPT
jgi:phage tail sheath gpL-like